MWTSQHLNTQHLRWCFIMELHEDIFSLREWQNPLKCFVHGEILALIPEMNSINLLNGLGTACTWQRGGTLRVSTGRPQSRGWVPVWQRESKKKDSNNPAVAHLNTTCLWSHRHPPAAMMLLSGRLWKFHSIPPTLHRHRYMPHERRATDWTVGAVYTRRCGGGGGGEAAGWWCWEGGRGILVLLVFFWHLDNKRRLWRSPGQMSSAVMATCTRDFKHMANSVKQSVFRESWQQDCRVGGCSGLRDIVNKHTRTRIGCIHIFPDTE